MIEGLAQVLLAIGALLVEIALWAIVGLYVLIRAIVSPTHREKIRREWHSGWKGKTSLLFSGVFWAALIAVAIYVWFPVRSSAV
jgi:hypothetical protein